MDPIEAPQSKQRKTGLTMLIVAWLILLGLLALFFNDYLTDRQNPNQLPTSSTTTGGVEVVLQPNYQHHYLVSGLINDQKVTFLLDTGATDVVIPDSLAPRLGLSRGRAHYANTANGAIQVYTTRLKSVAIGDIRLSDVRASLNPAMDGDVILLGMSALKEIEFTRRGELLILRQ